MADFPTLEGSGPVIQITEKPATEAADLRNPTDGGYVISRKRFTRVQTTFPVQYGPLTNTDHATLVAFIALHGATGNFNWTHPTTAVVHDVRFVKRPPLTCKGLYWYMSCELEEV